LLAYCDEIHEDDGVDPREFFKPKRNYEKQDRKAKQLCRQVAETLSLAISGDCHDETWQSLHVLAVEPAPDSSRLLVTVCADAPQEQFDRQSILDLLSEQMGRLRCEIAATITRKRVPNLMFHVISSTESEEVADE